MDARLRQMTFQASPKWQFWAVFHKKRATDASVRRPETSESALEMFDAVVCEKIIFNFFATFFLRNVPLRFR